MKFEFAEETPMNQTPEAIDRMLAAWNEKDPEKVRGHLDQALTVDVHFVDPAIDLVGIDAFEANVHETHKQIPGAVYSRTSDVDEHHRHHRYHWAIHLDGDLLLAGFDVAVTNADARVEKVIGFFGPLGSSTNAG
jgi:hypothetical protein